ncbi:MAG: hypothetical protein ACRC92_08350 [Peptostreptococcaceae bacterium]
MALGYLFILFAAMTVISIILVGSLYLIKNEKYKNVLFYILAIWSMTVTFLNVTSLPSNYILQRIIGSILGLLAVIAIFIKIKKPEKSKLAYFLVSASTILGLLDLFY